LRMMCSVTSSSKRWIKFQLPLTVKKHHGNRPCQSAHETYPRFEPPVVEPDSAHQEIVGAVHRPTAGGPPDVQRESVAMAGRSAAAAALVWQRNEAICQPLSCHSRHAAKHAVVRGEEPLAGVGTEG